ncbi:hypothetical protein BJX99DRAFT_214159 [Aspergillus californicus]
MSTDLQQKTPFDLPGLNLPLTFQPKTRWDQSKFANALDERDIQNGSCGHIYTIRELLMMRIMDEITDKPGWEKKVFNEEITTKWRKEIAESGQDVSELMIEYLLKELQWKAERYEQTGIVTAYDPGVVKSDLAIPPALQHQLRDAVRPLEEVPEEAKDYHPRSEKRVVDLVHPSLFPLVYGRSKILPDSLISVDDCFLRVGQGQVTELQPETQGPYHREGDSNPYSRRFQWLPCNVAFNANGECKIASYINNLHPMEHREMYSVLEQILTRTIPLWNISLRDPERQLRIPYSEAKYIEADPEPEAADSDEEQSEEFCDRYDAWKDAQQPVQPEPKGVFVPPEPRSDLVDLHAQFGDKGLQVIVKLANIELSPENPDYEGGAWHIEGQLNERICATAIYYYDSENITANTLAFRHRADTQYVFDVSYEQGYFEFLRAFGFEPDAGYGTSFNGSFTQDLGGVSTCPGRLLTFPNTLQHRVSPFSLSDRSKPGHRKILAFFLIDPTRRVISTANIPPQREDWCTAWKQAMDDVLVARKLPPELRDMIYRDAAFQPMTMDEAKAYRLELMDERSANSENGNRAFEVGGFNLCEH